MKAKIKIIIGCLLTALLTTSTYGCKEKTGNNNSTADADTAAAVKPVGPKFNADSAYAFTAAQCNFGPRTILRHMSSAESGLWISLSNMDVRL